MRKATSTEALINKFLDAPTEGTAYCSTLGEMCSGRQACLTRFHEARAKLNTTENRRWSFLRDLGASLPNSMIPPSIPISDEEHGSAKREAMATAALLERNCNEVCILELETA